MGFCFDNGYYSTSLEYCFGREKREDVVDVCICTYGRVRRIMITELSLKFDRTAVVPFFLCITN